MFEKYYKILKLDPSANPEDIKKAYRILAKKYHPDINKSPGANEDFIRIAEAYEILMNKSLLSAPRTERYTGETADRTYENFIRTARKRARWAAEMRYEKLKKEHEAFQKSGAYDLVLLLNYTFHVLLILLAIVFICIPVWISVRSGEWDNIYKLFFFWITGGFLIIYIYDQRRSYFRLGSFFYGFRDFKTLFEEKANQHGKKCFYAPSEKADSTPYKITMLRIEDIKLHHGGVFQHNVQYRRKYREVLIPRSRKAFTVHFLASVIKALTLLLTVIFLSIDNFAWRFISGLFFGGVLASALLMTTGIRSKISYLLNLNHIIKYSIWIIMIAIASDFSGFPNIRPHEILPLVVMLMLFWLDVILDPLFRLFSNKPALNRPLIKQHPGIHRLVENGYQYYLDIPVWSTIYPLFKWLF